MFLRQARSMLSPPSKNCNQLYSWLEPERDSKEPQDFGLTGNSGVESVATGHSLLQPTLNVIIEKAVTPVYIILERWRYAATPEPAK